MQPPHIFSQRLPVSSLNGPQLGLSLPHFSQIIASSRLQGKPVQRANFAHFPSEACTPTHQHEDDAYTICKQKRHRLARSTCEICTSCCHLQTFDRVEGDRFVHCQRQRAFTVAGVARNKSTPTKVEKIQLFMAFTWGHAKHVQSRQTFFLSRPNPRVVKRLFRANQRKAN